MERLLEEKIEGILVRLLPPLLKGMGLAAVTQQAPTKRPRQMERSQPPIEGAKGNTTDNAATAAPKVKARFRDSTDASRRCQCGQGRDEGEVEVAKSPAITRRTDQLGGYHRGVRATQKAKLLGVIISQHDVCARDGHT